jgi:AraC-like DNA-binding protein
LTHRTSEDQYLVAITLRTIDIQFAQDGILLYDGRLAAGAVQVSHANSESAAWFRGPCDVLHLHVPCGLVAKLNREALGIACVPTALCDDNRFFLDPEIERLGRTLLMASDMSITAGNLYTDALTLAIVTRILARQSVAPAGSTMEHGSRSKLPKWRMHRAVDYIEANLSLPIQLHDISASAGLTKMHFATQFRQSTGLSPRAYVIRRRIRKAKALLLQSQYNILEVAQSCGFATHAHFSSVFKKATGYSPSEWRVLSHAQRVSTPTPAPASVEWLAQHELDE